MIYKFYSVLTDKYTEGVNYSFEEGVSKRYENMTWLSANEPTEEQFNTWIDEYNAAEALRQVRVIRDTLLKETDWITIKAYDQQQPVPTDWANYRQALRDITQQHPQIDDNGVLIEASVTWPEKPLY